MTRHTNFTSADTTILRRRLTAVTGLVVVTPYEPTQGDCAVAIAEQGGGGGGVGGCGFGGLEGNLAYVLRF